MDQPLLIQWHFHANFMHISNPIDEVLFKQSWQCGINNLLLLFCQINCAIVHVSKIHMSLLGRIQKMSQTVQNLGEYMLLLKNEMLCKVEDENDDWNGNYRNIANKCKSCQNMKNAWWLFVVMDMRSHWKIEINCNLESSKNTRNAFLMILSLPEQTSWEIVFDVANNLQTRKCNSSLARITCVWCMMCLATITGDSSLCVEWRIKITFPYVHMLDTRTRRCLPRVGNKTKQKRQKNCATATINVTKAGLPLSFSTDFLLYDG